MKKILVKAVASILIFAIIIAGYFSGSMLSVLFYAVTDFPNYRSVANFQERVESASKDISFKDLLIDAQSLVYCLTGVSEITKDDEVIRKLDNGYLMIEDTIPDKERIDYIVNSFDELNRFAKEQGSQLVYCFAPTKSYCREAEMPQYTRVCNEILDLLRAKGIDVLNLAEKLEEDGFTFEDVFYVTDHHWKIETGFWAFGKLCRKLKTDYGFEYDEALTDINNYSSFIYEDWFLGSIGKKTGRFYSQKGLDEINKLLPTFDTAVSVQDIDHDSEGDFEQAFFLRKFFEKKNLHTNTPYRLYGDNYGEQIVINKSDEVSKDRVFVLRDSFACCVTPFLSLCCSELRAADLRTHLVGENRIDSVKEYISDYKPDYIIVLYSGFSLDDPITKFDMN